MQWIATLQLSISMVCIICSGKDYPQLTESMKAAKTIKPRLQPALRLTSVGVSLLYLCAAADRVAPDTQYAFGLTYPTPGTFYTTGGSPPFIPDALETTDSNEPYANVSMSDVNLCVSLFTRHCISGSTMSSLRKTCHNQSLPAMVTTSRRV